MTEMQIYNGKCKCGKCLDMRITPVRKKETNPKSKIISWLIYGFCKKCELVIMQGLFTQEEEPVQDVDFIIDYNKVIEIESSKQNS